VRIPDGSSTYDQSYRSCTPPFSAIGWSWPLFTAFAIVVATLTPLPEWLGSREHFWGSLAPRSLGAWIDVVDNVVLYLPFGCALAAAGVRRKRSVGIAAFAMSTAIELLQFIVPGRDPSASDIATNTVGAIVGAVLFWRDVGKARAAVAWIDRAASGLRSPDPRHANVFILIWSGVTAVVVAATGALVQPNRQAPPYIVPSAFVDATAGPLRFGSNGTPTGFFRGVIDDVRIFRKARGPDEIAGDMTRPVVASPAERDLVAAYAFDEGQGNVTHDASGRGHDGVLHGATWVSGGRFQSALAFDGRTAEVVIDGTPDLQLREGFTLEAWVKPIGPPAPWPAVIAKASDAYYLYASTDSGPFLAAGGGRFGSADEDTRTDVALRSDDWSHLAVTYDLEKVCLFVNGRFVSRRLRWSPHHVERAELGGLSLAPGPISQPEGVRSLLYRGTSLDLEIRCGRRAEEPAIVFRISKGIPEYDDLVALLSEGPDLLVRVATRAGRLGLPSPDSRVPGALAGCRSGATEQVIVGGALQNPRVSVGGRDVDVEAASAAGGLSMLLHTELMPSAWRRVLPGLWLCALCAPVGLWLRPNRVAALVAVVLLGSTLGVTWFWGLQSLRPIDWVSMVAGVGAGAALRRRSSDRESNCE